MFRDADDTAKPEVPPIKASRLRVRNKNKRASKNGGFWKKQARTWHWISGAICLAGMLLFSATGITLNHAAKIKAEPVITETTGTLPPVLLESLTTEPVDGYTRQLKEPIRDWIEDNLDVSVSGKRVEWTDIDAYVGLARPGGDAWLSIDRETGEVVHELTTRGAVALLNDLHKGRNTGPAWIWFIDIFSVASIIFCLTGLWLMQIHAAKRPSTWPITLIGVFIPIFLAVISIH